MKLLTEELKKKIPPFYTNEEKPMEEQIVVCKFFHPFSEWTWYVLEGQEEEGDYIFYGLVDGQELEFGYFALSELKTVPLIERDLYFEPQPVSNFHPGWKHKD